MVTELGVTLKGRNHQPGAEPRDINYHLTQAPQVRKHIIPEFSGL